MQTQAPRSTAAASDLNDALGNLAPVRARTPTTLLRDPRPQDGATCAGSCATPASVFARSASATASCAALIANSQPRLRHDGRARPASSQQIFQALPTFEQESATTIDRLDGVRRQHEPARHPAAPGGARAEPDAAAALGPRAGPARRCSRPRPARSTPPRPACRPPSSSSTSCTPLLGAARPVAARSSTRCSSGLGLLQAELTAFFANSVAATQADVGAPGTSALPAHDQPAEPREPGGLSEAARRRTGRTRTRTRATTTTCARAWRSFETRQCTPPDPLPDGQLPTSAILTPRPRCRGS